jgi:transposase
MPAPSILADHPAMGPVPCIAARPRRLPPRPPLGCHRQRVADRIIFDKLVQVLVFGCGYRKIADQACSATTIRDRRDQWITAGSLPPWSCSSCRHMTR